MTKKIVLLKTDITLLVIYLVGNTELISKHADTLIGNIDKDDILFVVYTERIRRNEAGRDVDVIRLISARYATNFERGLYYGKY